MKKMGTIIILVVFLLCCVEATIVLYNLGFWSFPLPKRNFAPRDLLLTVEDLGEGWSVLYDHGYPMGNYSTILEQWNRHFVYKLDSQDRLKLENFVYRCDNKQHAKAHFREEKLYSGKYPAPEELQALFQPQYADEWLLFGDAGYAAVYDEYFILFNLRSVLYYLQEGLGGDIRDGVISYEQIANWLKLLDERAGQLIGKAGKNR
ncbi:MAG: hypothetical protein ACK8QZ_07290 [Anaerolineales bacterium]